MIMFYVDFLRLYVWIVLLFVSGSQVKKYLIILVKSKPPEIQHEDLDYV